MLAYKGSNKHMPPVMCIYRMIADQVQHSNDSKEKIGIAI